MPAPHDAERRLAEASRALHFIAGMNYEFLFRTEIFDKCPYNDIWQRNLLRKFESAGLIVRNDTTDLRELRWKSKDKALIQKYIEEPEEISKLLWPDTFGYAGLGDTHEEEEPAATLPAPPPPEEVFEEVAADTPIEIELLTNVAKLLVNIQTMLVAQKEVLDEMKIEHAVMLDGMVLLEKRLMQVERMLEEKKDER